MSRGRKIRAEGQYWGEAQDAAITAYQLEQDHVKRSIIFSRDLYHQLFAMGETILKKYFKKDDVDLVQGAIAHVCTRAIRKFEIKNGKSYSYMQAVIKFYFMDMLGITNAPKIKEYSFISIDQLNVEALASERNLIQAMDDEDLTGSAKVKLKKMMAVMGGDPVVRTTLEYLMEISLSEESLTTEYHTLQLLIRTGLRKEGTLRYRLSKYEIKIPLSTNARIENRLRKYAKEHYQNYDGLNSINEIQEWHRSALVPSIQHFKAASMESQSI